MIEAAEIERLEERHTGVASVAPESTLTMKELAYLKRAGSGLL